MRNCVWHFQFAQDLPRASPFIVIYLLYHISLDFAMYVENNIGPSRLARGLYLQRLSLHLFENHFFGKLSETCQATFECGPAAIAVFPILNFAAVGIWVGVIAEEAVPRWTFEVSRAIVPTMPSPSAGQCVGRKDGAPIVFAFVLHNC